MSQDDRLIFLLSTAQQAVKRHANKILAAEGIRITVAQSGILFLLKQQDRRMISELGKILGIENSAMTGLVDRLEKLGFVTRIMDPADRRALLICATPAGLEEVERAKPIIRRVNEAIKTGFSEYEIDVLKRVLADISEFKGM
ncbi:MAG: MarR family winged helix-turn-helix transcriptional regulator [Desulfomonilaceae bacterium]